MSALSHFRESRNFTTSRFYYSDLPAVVSDREKKTPKWKGRFRFRPESKNTELEEFQKNLDVTQDSKENEFHNISFCAIQTKKGIKALICNTYMEKEYLDDYTDKKRSKVISSQQEIQRILKEVFDIQLDHELHLPGTENIPF